jgi:hypothetical protein
VGRNQQVVRLYPEIPSRRLNVVLHDLAIVALLVLFAWLGLEVHDSIDRLAVLGEGVEGAGTAVQSGFDSAADAVAVVPLVGDRVADGLRSAGAGTGGDVAERGRRGQDSVHRLATLLGLVTFLVPSLVLLVTTLPGRIALARRLTTASEAFGDLDQPDRRELIAARAAFSLPYDRLLEHTPDPFGDLSAGRYDGLVAAALEDAGLRRHLARPG